MTVTNGAEDSTITAQLLPPMAPQNVFLQGLTTTFTFAVHVLN
jgi:hypothetical protein